MSGKGSRDVLAFFVGGRKRRGGGRNGVLEM